MLEGTPARPYSGYAADLVQVERNMRIRRARILAALKPNEICPTVPCFPMMGVGDFTVPSHTLKPGLSDSLFIPDEIIHPAPRFAALVANIKRRRGSKVDIRVPRFKDVRTRKPQRPKGCPPPSTLEEADEMEEVYMDAMAFGMGCCCLQVTFQARDVSESRHLYDHLAVLGPMMLALTAATPIARGQLLDTDVRWDIIAQSVDDRTLAERGAVQDGPSVHDQMAGHGVRRLGKSRYDSISSFICNHLAGKNDDTRTEKFNDIDAPVDEEAYKTLVQSGVDDILARHIAHLFIRDPLVIYRERVELDDDTETDHFENIQSTNWQTVRWKPPPPKAPLTGDSHIGWRTEFRSMEVQLTDFENAAFTIFVVLVSRVILYFNLNFYMPLSAVDANMRKAHIRDAINTQKFCFRQSPGPVVPGEAEHEPLKREHSRAPLLSDEMRHATSCCCGGTEGVEEFTLHEIIAGKESFKGLAPLILTYLDLIETDTATMKIIGNYLDFIVARASGELMTPAQWMRKFVQEHPDYKGDSIVPQKVAADLMAKCHRIGLGLDHVPELHGDFYMAPIQTKDAYAVDMGDSRRRHSISVDNTQELMLMHQMRLQMQARRRKLAAEEVKHIATLDEIRSELRNLDAQLGVLSAS
mmetsp:Transcript_9798/g.31530  ORF Transcript_9798/g.31530 Transcript_9798/m.31530 type:complete len:640 (+) Transcript_9798:504-2423(+)